MPFLFYWHVSKQLYLLMELIHGMSLMFRCHTPLMWRYADPVWDLHFIFSGRCHWSSAWSHLWVPQASNTAAAYQNTAFGNIFYETSGSLLPGGVLLTIPHIQALKLAFDTTNYWNPHILILVGALPNHRRDQHSIFSKRKGLTSLSYFKYTVGYF